MLALEKQTGQFQNFNLRPEKHGDENVPGADLKIQVTASNDILSEFHPSLKASLYRAPHPGEMDMVDQAEENPAQGSVDGVKPEPTVRVFGDLIEKIRLKHELVGAKVLIDFGLGGDSDIELDTADVDGFAVEMMEGGSVVTTFRVKCHPSGEQVKKLYEVLGNEITISITPAADKQGSLGLNLEPEAA
ncbi:hypothetical protein GHR37_29215 [Achromobacter xylosoxidans]|nr:hypothetical protein [Achromobacter xylosoxidans]